MANKKLKMPPRKRPPLSIEEIDRRKAVFCANKLAQLIKQYPNLKEEMKDIVLKGRCQHCWVYTGHDDDLCDLCFSEIDGG